MNTSNFLERYGSDPMKIISNGFGISSIGYFDVIGMANVLKQVIINGSALVTLGMLIMLLFTTNSSKLQELKEEVSYRFILIFLISSSVTIFSFIKGVMDFAFFGG